jgi:hypothetical protein
LSITALSCPQCGAPLPSPGSADAFLECAFCRATLRQGGGADRGATPEERPSWDGAVERCVEAVKASRGEDFLALLERVGREQLGPKGETLALRNIVANLIGDYEAEEGVTIRNDPIAVGRLLEGYLRACEQLAVADSAVITLPFLTTDVSGPKHYTRTVTASELAKLAAREPKLLAQRGFFSRLFSS